MTLGILGGESGCDYCARMRRTGQWGTAAEILALTRALHRPIAVYTRQAAGAFKLLDTYGAEMTKGGGSTLSILYVSAVHYMALLHNKNADGNKPASVEGDWASEFKDFIKSRL